MGCTYKVEKRNPARRTRPSRLTYVRGIFYVRNKLYNITLNIDIIIELNQYLIQYYSIFT